MNVVIVEDELLAAEKLASQLIKYDSEINILARCTSVKNTIEWFNSNPLPNLVFMDIQLGDGLSFEIFESAKIDCPIIFTTAYDEYALRAFRVNSLDYLLKPINTEDLFAALKKYVSSPWNPDQKPANNGVTYEKVMQLLTKEYKQRFLVKVGKHIKTIDIESIIYFYSLEKSTFFTDKNGKNYLTDYTLEQVEELIDPAKFFRINRKYITTIVAIDDMYTLSNYRLKLKLKHCNDDDIFVSRDKMNGFKAWLDR